MPILTGEEDARMFATAAPVAVAATPAAPPPYTPVPVNPYADLIAAWQRSGLSMEDFKRQILAVGQPPPAPMTVAPPYSEAPVQPVSNIQALEAVAMMVPPKGTSEVAAMQREAFNYDPNAIEAAQGRRVIPELPLGTPEGRKAVEQALRGVIPMEQVPTAERITDWTNQQALAEGYREIETATGAYWQKGVPSQPSMLERAAGLVKNVVGGAVENMPVVGPIAELAEMGVEKTAPYAMEGVKKGLDLWQEYVVEPKAGALIQFGRGLKEGDIREMGAAWAAAPPEAREEYHKAPVPMQVVTSILADPLTWVGGGFGKAGVAKFLARRGVIGPTSEMAAQLAAEADEAARAGVRASLWIPGESGRVEDGAKILTPEILAKEEAAKSTLGRGKTLLTGTGEVWKPYTPEQTSARIIKVNGLADAEPTVALTLEDAMQLPRTQALTYEYQATRETTLRTGGAAAEKAMDQSRNELTWALREQTQTAPSRVPIGDNGISMGEAAKAFRNHEGYVVGGYNGIPAQFHYYDTVDDVVNRLGGFEPIRPRPRPDGAVAQVAKAAAETTEKEIIASVKNQPLDLKLSRLLSLNSSEKAWNTLSRSERVAVLRGAGLDTALATHRWKTLASVADRAEIVRQMRNLAMGVGREMGIVTPAQAAAPAAGAAAQLVTPAQAAGEDALLKEAIDIMVEQAKIAKKARPKLAQAYHIERVTRAGRLREAGSQQLGEAGMALKRQAATGELAPGIKPFTGMGQAHRDAILNAIDRSEKLLDWEKFNLQEGLIAQWDGVKFLQPAQLEKLERAFGPEVAQAMADLQKTGLTAMDVAKFGAMLPTEVGRGMMTFLTAIDLSASFRQGVVMAFSHPISGLAKPFWKQVAAALSQTKFEALDLARKMHPNYQLYTEDFGLKIRDMASSLSGNQAEQYKGFLSRFMEKYVPGVKQSQRAFITFLNEQRFNIMDDWYQAYSKGGDVPIEQARGWARWVNWASGEGSLPEGGAAGLTSIMWAPKLATSRFQMPFASLFTNGVARRAILRDQLTFAGVVASFLATAKLTGVADVELDPRSTEFGKMRIGNTRIDITGGEVLLLRTLCQLVGTSATWPPKLGTGLRKDLQGGFYEANRWKIAGRFFQGKLQPGVGFLYDLSQGHTFIGDELTATGETIKTQAFNRLVPLFIQDMADAVQEWGPKGIFFGGLSFLGFGVQTYSSPWTTLAEVKDEAAQRRGYKNFADMAGGDKGIGTNAASALIRNDWDVAAAQQRAEAYREAHGGPRPGSELMVSYRNEQQSDDWQFVAGVLPLKDWIDRNRTRNHDQMVSYDAYLASNPDVKKRQDKELEGVDPFALPKDPTVDLLTAAYYSLFDKYEKNGVIDDAGWQALDQDIARFEAQLSPEQKDGLYGNIAATKTPIERYVTGLREQVEAAGWWKPGETAWTNAQNDPAAIAEQLSTKTKPLTADDVAGLSAVAKQFKSMDEYQTAVYQRALQATGSWVAAAEALAADPLTSAVGSMISDAHKGILEAHPELGETVVALGYTNIVNAQLAKVLAAEGHSLREVNLQLLAIGHEPIGGAEEAKKAEADYAAGVTPASVAPTTAPVTPAATQAPPTAAPTQEPVVQFLETGKASHPDEQQVQDEYDVMIKAVTTGQGVEPARAIAQSHLAAHQRALLPEEQGGLHDPYPGEPEKNQQAVYGFGQVLAALGPTSAIGVPPVLSRATLAPAPTVVPAAGVTPATGTAASTETGTATSTGATIAASPAVTPAATAEKPAVGSFEAVVSRIKGEEPYPQAGVIDMARVVASLAGIDLATTPAGLPPDQLKAKVAKGAQWAPWITETTWQTLGALGMTGRANILDTFWRMYGAAANSTLAKTVGKNEDVKRVLLNLQTLGSATTEMYMRAFEAMTKMFTEAVTGAQEDESKALQKEILKQQKKAESEAKKAAKKAASAAEKEAETAAQTSRWERLAEELAS